MYNKCNFHRWIILVLFYASILHLILLINCSKKEESSTKTYKSDKNTLIVGVWIRPIRDAVERMEGLNIKNDGSFDLVGIYSMKGLNWRIDGDSLSLTTNTGRYPEPFESKFLIEVLNDSTFKLSTSGGYLGGIYKRQTSAKVYGTITSKQQIVLPPNAIINIALTDKPNQDKPPKIIAEKNIKAEDKQLPIPYEIKYNPAIIESNHTYSVQVKITSENKTLFKSTKRYLVITRGNPNKIEILVHLVK